MDNSNGGGKESIPVEGIMIYATIWGLSASDDLPTLSPIHLGKDWSNREDMVQAIIEARRLMFDDSAAYMIVARGDRPMVLTAGDIESYARKHRALEQQGCSG